MEANLVQQIARDWDINDNNFPDHQVNYRHNCVQIDNPSH